jgi:hypothetical protein
MANETDLLKDPLIMAQQLYQDQIKAFKDQHIPTPTQKDANNWAKSHGFRPRGLTSRSNTSG